MSRVLDDEYITVAEAARALKVSQSTIWRWVNSGDLPAHRVGQRGVRLKSTEIARLITPARQGVRKGGVRIELQMERERLSRPMTKEEKEGALAALDAVEQLAKEILARHGLERFTLLRRDPQRVARGAHAPILMICLDASLAAKLLLEENDSERATHYGSILIEYVVVFGLGMVDQMSKVTSIRLGDELCARLDRLAALMDRPRTWVIEQAITRYVEDELQEVEAIKEALDEYHSGRAELVPHEEVMKRLEERMRTAGV